MAPYGAAAGWLLTYWGAGSPPSPRVNREALALPIGKAPVHIPLEVPPVVPDRRCEPAPGGWGFATSEFKIRIKIHHTDHRNGIANPIQYIET